ncbi:uncharacterized protein LOC129693413 isoform X3 [Leucoraja erinacea]|uniref:uncharacterized protein LOC129693413 isoform X3 n=1 Tax=Leucoraja erinaceus TaxID=7782 RepID=UPI0024564A4F|nr:uncharacterized protein LOC129693413 isoform X3 [Leucoraja erinacea]
MDAFRALSSRGITWAVDSLTALYALSSRGITWILTSLTALYASSRGITWILTSLTALYASFRGITWWNERKTVHCQVECYGEGNVHTDIVRLLNISVCENPGIPLVLFIYKVSRETVDLRNALQWIEDNRGRKKEDICAVILLEKFSDTDKKPVEVAHLGMFNEKTAVVRILWEHRQIPLYESREKVLTRLPLHWYK